MSPRFGAALLTWFLLAPASIPAEDLLILTQGALHPMAEVCQIILPEAYQRLGFTVKFIQVPPNRADAMINSGEADAFIFSDRWYTQNHPGTVEVPVPVGYDALTVYSRSATFEVKGWASLKPYRVGFLKGMWVVEQHMDQLQGESANRPDLVLLKLNAGRTDLAVLPAALAAGVLANQPIPEIKTLAPPLEIVPLYHILAAKDAALSLRLAAVLRDLEAEGKIFAATTKVYSRWHLRSYQPPVLRKQ
jgi:polar amino acid transport system substrate-binding protein